MKYWAMFTALGLGCAAASGAEPVSFNREVRPILSDKCFACHGPDSVGRKGGLRLDREEDARGKFATVLEKARSQLDTVRNSIDAAGVRTRAIERQLRGVESLPVDDARKLLGEDAPPEE